MVAITNNERRIEARTALFLTARADYDATLVRIDGERVRELNFPKTELTLMTSGLVGKTQGTTLHNAIAFLLILNSQNFRFWDLKDGKFVRYAYEGSVGAAGMRKAFDRAWGDCPTPHEFGRQFEERGVAGLFGEIPDAEERTRIFSEILSEQVEGLSETLSSRIAEQGRFTLEDARDIAEAFPCSYADPYLKKAQLALAEIAGFCAEIGERVDCSELTLCADYQLPRVLRALGVFHYSAELARKVDAQELVARDSREERALRAATILVGEMMAKAFNCTPAAVDNYLWTNKGLAGCAPFHLTMTTAY